MPKIVDRDNVRIYRIMHRHNFPLILDDGLPCRNMSGVDSSYRNIGNSELIDKRGRREVPIPPGGTLNDYVPFYFTPHSPMLLNIRTGRGVPHIQNSDIIILVTSFPRLAELDAQSVFSDRHAYLASALFYNQLSDLGQIDWDILNDATSSKIRTTPEKRNDIRRKPSFSGGFRPDALLGSSATMKGPRRS